MRFEPDRHGGLADLALGDVLDERCSLGLGAPVNEDPVEKSSSGYR
jgi:hypothetical protein